MSFFLDLCATKPEESTETQERLDPTASTEIQINPDEKKPESVEEEKKKLFLLAWFAIRKISKPATKLTSNFLNLFF